MDDNHQAGFLGILPVMLLVLLVVVACLLYWRSLSSHKPPQLPVVSTPASSSNGFPMSGYSIGADIDPADFLPNEPDQPTGSALIKLLQENHMTAVRLLFSPPESESVPFGQLNHGGWKTVFDELSAANIKAVLLLTGEYTPDGQFTGKAWQAPVYRGVQENVPAAQQMSTAEYDQNEAGILNNIKAQYGGKLPPSLVGIEVANEPTVDAQTIPMLEQSVKAMKQIDERLPVTIGGWRAPDASGRVVYNQPQVTRQVAPFVDFISVHLYPDNVVRLQPGQDPTDASTYLPYAQQYISTVISEAAGKPIVIGEFGGRSGLDPTAAEGPSGSPAHQSAVIQAVTQAMSQYKNKGITGGTVWLLVPHEGAAQTCDTFALVCFQPQVTQPGLSVLSQAADQ